MRPEPPDDPRPPGSSEPARRRFLGRLTLALSALALALPGVPALLYLLAPGLRSTGGRAAGAAGTASAGAAGGEAGFVPVARLATLTPGRYVRLALHGRRVDAWTVHEAEPLGSVWLRREAADQIRCFTSICPHLACTVDFDAASARFVCPCHRSRFSDEGKRLDGPAPRDLDALEARVRDGVVEVRLERFRAGIAERRRA